MTREEAAVVIDMTGIDEMEIVVCARGRLTLVVQRVDVLDQYL
jgi:hypothetical protein